VSIAFVTAEALAVSAGAFAAGLRAEGVFFVAGFLAVSGIPLSFRLLVGGISNGVKKCGERILRLLGAPQNPGKRGNDATVDMNEIKNGDSVSVFIIQVTALS
jgi:hypothetical protein